KHHELSKFTLTIQNMPQRRTQRRNPGTHRDKNQITSFHFVDHESASADVKQFDLVPHMHVVNDAAGAYFLFHKHFKFSISGRSGESEVSRFLTFHTQNRNLP